MRQRSLTQIFIHAHLYGIVVIGVFVIALPIAATHLDGSLPATMPGALRPVGYGLLGVSACLSYASFIVLVGTGRGTAFPTDPPRRFVAAGPYRYVRNPMYIGNFGMVLALSLIWMSPGVLLYLVALCLLTDRYLALVEEPKLIERFGCAYESYRHAVRRWIPSLSPWLPD